MAASDKTTKPAPLKIADWPWWLEYPYVAICVLILSLLLEIYFELLWGRFRHLLWDLSVGAGIVVIVCLPGIYHYFRSCRVDNTGPREKLPSPMCPTCGYDVRATLLRCPECGSDTQFKLWLDRQSPIERALFENRLRPSGADSSGDDGADS